MIKAMFEIYRTENDQLRLKEVYLANESGKALYCDDCRKNSQRSIANDMIKNISKCENIPF